MPTASIFVPGYGWLALGGSSAPIPGETGTVGPYRIAMHADLPDGFAVAAFTTGISPLGPRSARHVDASRYDRIRMLLHVQQAGGAGSIGIQYVDASNTAPAEGDWNWADGVAGPRLPVTTAGTVQIASPYAPLALGARGDVQFRAVAIDGNNTPGLFIQSLDVELAGTDLSGGDGGGVPPQPEPCTQVLLEQYANTAAMLAAWTPSQIGSATPVWTLDSTHALSGTAIKMTLTGTVAVNDQYLLSYPVTGLVPGAYYTYHRSIYPIGDVPAGFTPGTFTQISSTLTADASGTATLNIGTIIVSGSGPVSDQWWFDGIETCVPTNTPVTITPLPPAGARRLTLWGYTTGTWGQYPPFNGALVNVTASNVVSVCNQARSAGMRLLLNCVLRSEAKSVGGIFTQGAYLAKLNTFSALALEPYADVIIAFMVIDEPQLATQGGWGTVVPLSVVDGVLSKRYYDLWPSLRRMVRVSPSMWKQSGVTAGYTTSLYPVFAGSRQQQGISAFMAAEKAVAAQLAATAGHPVDVMWGVNVTGSGPSGGTITPASIHQDQVPMARDTASLGVGLWVPSDSGGPTAAVDFLKTTPFVTAFTEVAAALVP